jgi:hypothetical protein
VFELSCLATQSWLGSPARTDFKRVGKELVFRNVLFPFIVAAMNLIESAKASPKLAICEEATSEDRQFVLLFDVVRKQSAPKNPFTFLGKHQNYQVQQVLAVRS